MYVGDNNTELIFDDEKQKIYTKEKVGYAKVVYILLFQWMRRYLRRQTDSEIERSRWEEEADKGPLAVRLEELGDRSRRISTSEIKLKLKFN